MPAHDPARSERHARPRTLRPTPHRIPEVASAPRRRATRAGGGHMAEFESGWKRHPDYRIDLVPCDARVRVWHGDTLLAESERCIRLLEQHHVERLYVPKDD